MGEDFYQPGALFLLGLREEDCEEPGQHYEGCFILRAPIISSALLAASGVTVAPF